MPTKVKGTTGVDKIESGAVITNPSFSGNATVTGTLTVNSTASINGSNISTQPSFRNLIINGDMRIAQRGTSVTGITTAGYYTVDRMRYGLSTSGTWTHAQDTDIPSGQGFAFSHKLSCTTSTTLSAGSFIFWQQIIEGQNLQAIKKGTANAESLTLSFWVKTNKTGTFTAELYDNDNTRSISQLFTISAANTWEKKAITFPGDTTGTIVSDNSSGLTVQLWLAAGSNYTSGTLATSWEASTTANRAVGQTINLADSTSNYFNITGVQLEVGSGASDFEFLPYDVQLARCQRYYYKTGGTIRYYKNSSNTNAEAYPLGFPVYMRVSPSMSFGSVSTGARVSTYSIAGASNQSVSVQITADGVAGYARLDAELIADAEL